MQAGTTPKIKRTFTVQQRSDMLRPRMADLVALLGHNDQEFGLKVVSRRAVDVAKVRDMRTWNDTNQARGKVGCAYESLTKLLGLRINPTDKARGHNYTGRNAHWVLDIWEAVLEEIFHSKPTPKPRPEDPSDALLGTGTQEHGVQVEATAAPAPADTPAAPKTALAMRILEAYIARDDDAILEVANEVGKMEGTK